MTSVHFLVCGRVQGVGFRRFVLSVATRNNIAGWVKNTQDGCVEVLAKGGTEDIVKLLDACREGPFFSSVSDLHFRDDADVLSAKLPSDNTFFIQR